MEENGSEEGKKKHHVVQTRPSPMTMIEEEEDRGLVLICFMLWLAGWLVVRCFLSCPDPPKSILILIALRISNVCHRAPPLSFLPTGAAMARSRLLLSLGFLLALLASLSQAFLAPVHAPRGERSRHGRFPVCDWRAWAAERAPLHPNQTQQAQSTLPFDRPSLQPIPNTPAPRKVANTVGRRQARAAAPKMMAAPLLDAPLLLQQQPPPLGSSVVVADYFSTVDEIAQGIGDRPWLQYFIPTAVGMSIALAIVFSLYITAQPYEPPSK